MNAIRELKAFILFKLAEGAEQEIRPFILSNLQRIATCFNVEAGNVAMAMKTVRNDRVLGMKLLESIAALEMGARQSREDRRRRRAQASADILGASVKWEGEKAHLDIVSLLASALTKRNHLLVFSSDTFTTGVYMAPLLDLSKVSRAQIELVGWVDASGLHLNWRSGHLNLYPQQDQKAARIVVPLAAVSAVVAA